MKVKLTVEWEDDNIHLCLHRSTLLAALRMWFGDDRIDEKLEDGTLKVKENK